MVQSRLSRKVQLTLLIVSTMVAASMTTATSCWSLAPHEVLLIANASVEDSVKLSKYYMNLRNIPEDHLVVLNVPNKEEISGVDYEVFVAGPIRNYLKDRGRFRFIRCLLLMYGMPLKVIRPDTPHKEAKLSTLKTRRDNLKEQMNGLKLSEEKDRVEQELNRTKTEIFRLQKTNRSASLDAEIALVLEEDHDLLGWIPNPSFWGNRGKSIEIPQLEPFMVSRLDGPSAETVRKIVLDTLSAEKEGLQGTAYFDARWPKPKEKMTSGYAFYDQSIHLAAERIRKKHLMPVVLDDREGLFKPGDCPNAAIYCGWYSLKKYIGAFDWQQGAVGYHIASLECTTLKRKESQAWCKRMIDEGVVATLGPVGEPYVQAFPPPEIFFGLLIDGRFSLAKCFAMSNPFLSWKMVLIGDPLYRPFAKTRTEDTSPLSP